MHAPRYYQGKRLQYEELFVSAFVKPTKEEAARVLDSIRESHNEESGWVEISSSIERKPDGYVALRHHAKYV